MPGSRPASRTLTTDEVRETLSRGPTALAADEEKVLRLRLGVPVRHDVLLERVGQENPETRERLLGIELELLRQLRERQRTAAAPEPQASAAPSNPRRDRIVAALRARKPSE